MKAIKNDSPYMETYTGKVIDPVHFTFKDVDIIDIAHSLSLQCRFAGHIRSFYSVAEHCVLLSKYCLNLAKQAGRKKQEAILLKALYLLLHDAHEAYTNDIIRPVKQLLSADNLSTIYQVLQVKIQAIILSEFKVFPTRDIKLCAEFWDMQIILDEKKALLPSEVVWDFGCEPLGVKIHAWDPQTAEIKFLTQFYKLCENLEQTEKLNEVLNHLTFLEGGIVPNAACN